MKTAVPLLQKPVSPPQRADGADDPYYQSPQPIAILDAQQTSTYTISADSGMEAVRKDAFLAIGRMMMEDQLVVKPSKGLTVHIKSYPTSQGVKESEVLIQQEDIAKQYLAHYFNPLHIINVTNEEYQYNNLINLYYSDTHYVFRNDHATIVFSVDNAWIQEDGCESYKHIFLQSATIKWQLKQNFFPGYKEYGVFESFNGHIQASPTTIQGVTQKYEDLNNRKTDLKKLKLYSVLSDGDPISREEDALQVPVALRDLNFSSVFSLFIASQNEAALKQVESVIFEIPHSVLHIFNGEFAIQMLGVYHYLKPSLNPSVTTEFNGLEDGGALLDQLTDALAKEIIIDDGKNIIQLDHFYNKNQTLFAEYCIGLDDVDINTKDELNAKHERNSQLIQIAQTSLGNTTVTQESPQNLRAKRDEIKVKLEELNRKYKELNRKRQNTIAKGDNAMPIINEQSACKNERTILECQLKNEEIEQSLAVIQKKQSILFQLIAFSKKNKDRVFSSLTTVPPPRTVSELISDVQAIIKK